MMVIVNESGLSTNAGPGSEQYPSVKRSEAAQGPYEIRRISLDDLKTAVMRGFEDWRACRTDVLVMVVLYPLAALFLAGVIVDQALFPFLFPICAGFALIGPLATLWFTALSRQRERDGVATTDAAGEIFNSPRIVTIQRLAGLLMLLFIAWVAIAGIIYGLTLGSSQDGAGAGFFVRVFTTGAGYEMIVLGCLVGAVFAAVALCVGFISFSLALDRNISTLEAARVSTQAALKNWPFCLAWGGLIVIGFLAGTLPALLGLAITIPVLGHANWHIYRRVIS